MMSQAQIFSVSGLSTPLLLNNYSIYLSIVPFVEEAVHGPNVNGSAPISDDILEYQVNFLLNFIQYINAFNILIYLIYIIL